MVQRGFGISLVAAMMVLFISIAVDMRAAFSLKAFSAEIFSPRPFFMPIGPRRYPPGYRPTVFVSQVNPSTPQAGHQTVIKN